MSAGTKTKDPKIVSQSDLLKIRKKLRSQGRSVVLTNGCFDLLHAGHIRLFHEAKAQGNVLVVALNDDASVRRLKGPSRPVFPLAERLEVLAAVSDIDYVTWFSEDTPQRIISALLPDVLVKGGDWTRDTVIGRPEVEAAGGKVVIVPYTKGKSTTNIIDKMRKLSA